MSSSRVAVVAFCLAVTGTAAHAQALTLNEALESAYTTNSALKSAQEVARSQQLTAYSRWGNALPTLTAEGYWGGTRYDANNQTDFIHPRGTGVTLSQPIFTGGEILHAARAASANARAAESDAHALAQNTLLATTQAYTGVLTARVQVSATESLVASLARQADAATARLRAGEGTTTDVALTTARREEAEGNLALTRANLVAQQNELARLTNLSLTSTSALTWPEIPPASPHHLPSKAVAELGPYIIRTSSASISPTIHPEFQAALARARAAEATRQSVRGTMIPDLNATATASQNEDNSLARTSGSQMAYQLRLTVPLFAGFSRFNDTRAASANARAADDTLADTRAVIEARQATATPNLAAARANLTAAETALIAQQNYYTSISKTYTYGESSLLDLLDAAQALANAEANLAAARANLINQSYTYLAAYGQLTTPPVSTTIVP